MSGAAASRQERWGAATATPLVLLSFVFLVTLSVVVLVELPPFARATGVVLLVAIWLVFLVDYLVRLALASRRAHFLAHSVPELVCVVLPALRPAVQLLRFRSARAGVRRVNLVLFALAFALLYVYSVALGAYSVERDAPGSTMHTFGDAVWWACATLFTVGYGDVSPVTGYGRAMGVALMVGGVAIIGVATAVVVSYLNERAHGSADRPDAPPDDRL